MHHFDINVPMDGAADEPPMDSAADEPPMDRLARNVLIELWPTFETLVLM